MNASKTQQTMQANPAAQAAQSGAAEPPGAFDLQVNGYAGVDFNKQDLTAEELHACCERLVADGVGGILAAIITENVELMASRVARLAELAEQDPLAGQVVQGIHIEGPFINPEPGYRGAHPEDAVRPADPDTMRQLIDAGKGMVRLLTLAPEQDVDCDVTRWLVTQGITVSAGHSDASLDQLRAAADAGLSMYTHLGNGCLMHMHRHDNIIQRALSLHDRLWLCFIADGVHIPFFALGNYLRAAGLERAIVTTDAMAAAGQGPGRFRIARWDLVVGEDGAARSPDGSHLVGSAMTMPQARANLEQHLGLDAAQVDRLTHTNPRKALGLSLESE